ncbi:diguanylate cyclase [Nisaea acidiphila]|uniref:Diguanylate cyclase n=1 Tax=Nisaea acidiphila TaxID=1862145 RepID=A0A9J7AR28_9PROT|nr:diguanylate cyclase [Nisaea acidiphila]UUX49695.1 diguanylate cyclase [Nisaea acidiphila]
MDQIGARAVDGLPLLQSVLDAMGQGLLVIDRHRRVIAANPRFEALFERICAVSPIGQELEFIISAADPDSAIPERVSADSGFGPERLAVGETVQEVRGNAVPEIGYLITFNDVTGHVRAEQAALSHEQRVREILDHSPVGVNIIAPDGRRLYSNRKIQEMCGLSAEELAETHAGTHYADSKLRDQLLERMRREGAIENEEVEFVRRDGTPFWVLLSCRSFEYDGEDCVLSWLYEITDRIELERRQIRSREELEIQILELRDREDRMAQQAAELESLAIRLSESERKMAELANFDSLTGLPTSRLCMDRMQLAMANAKRDQTLTAVFYVDLDGFKAVNDTFGHDAGDLVLKEVAGRMNQCFREVDTVARIGGDEFLVVLWGLGFRDAVTPLADRLLGCFEEEFVFPDGRAKIGASIGIAFFNGASDTPDTLIKRADKAMYVAKKGGKNQYAISES